MDKTAVLSEGVLDCSFVDTRKEEISAKHAWACLSLLHDDVHFTILLNVPHVTNFPCRHALSNQGLQILHDKLSCDMKIICLDKQEISCHKSVLMGMKQHKHMNIF